MASDAANTLPLFPWEKTRARSPFFPWQSEKAASSFHPSKDLKLDDEEINVEELEPTSDSETEQFTPSWSLYCVFAVLCLLSFLGGIDGSIINVALPTITKEIGAANDQLYIWIAQCFLFASTAPQPLYGQISNIFGRRNPYIAAITLFALGSGIAGGAQSPAMLIAGRTVQGLGAAGLYVLSDIVICDLVPPRHRGPYLSAVLSTAAIGTAVGPIFGGAIAEHNWRWIFYLNIPIAVMAFAVMIVFLKVNYKRAPSWSSALARVDFLGAAIFIPSMISLFYALVTGGTQHPWSSWKVIVPLVLGICGWMAYHLQQATPSLCASPSTPSHLFTNRTSATGFALIFLSSLVLYNFSFFIPFYFQAVKQYSPLLSGVYYLPFALILLPFAGLSGWALSNWGQYIPLHYVGSALLATGAGLFATLSDTSSRVTWVGLQIIPSVGSAIMFTTTLVSTLAPLQEEDVAVATATYSFVRASGMVWGITIAGSVFNGQVNARLHSITDENLRDALKNGAAYAFAVKENGLKAITDEKSLAQIIKLYVGSLRVVWFVVMGIALLSFILVPLEKAIELKTNHSTDFGLEDQIQTKTNEGVDQTS